MENMQTSLTDCQYRCNICSQCFEQPQFLSRHVKVEHERIYIEKENCVGESSKFQCQYCEKSYTNKPNLIRHVNGSHSNRQYSCELCLKVFSRSDHFAKHFNAVHEQDKNFQSGQCEKSFAKKSNLDI